APNPFLRPAISRTRARSGHFRTRGCKLESRRRRLETMGHFVGRALLIVAAGALFTIECGGTESESSSHKKDASADTSAESSNDAAEETNADVADVGPPGITAGSCGALAWAHNYGGDQGGDLASDEAVLAVVTDAAGNIYATGRYRGDADFGGGPRPAG